MIKRADAAVDELRSRLKQSREKVSVLMDPLCERRRAAAKADGQSVFPRSRTMRMLSSRRSLGAIGVLAGGFLIARPRLALKLFRLLPKGAVTKTIIARLVGG
jgi:hypothetical protein